MCAKSFMYIFLSKINGETPREAGTFVGQAKAECNATCQSPFLEFCALNTGICVQATGSNRNNIMC